MNVKNNTKQNDHTLLTVEDLMDLLKVSDSFVYHIPRSELPVYKAGSGNRYLLTDLWAYLDRKNSK